jgi:hypothetical protein
MFDADEIENALYITEKLHDAIYRMIREWPKMYLGQYEWLLYAIGEHDFWLRFEGDNIGCTGNSYSMQTMSNEWYEFQIPVKDVQEWLELFAER